MAWMSLLVLLGAGCAAGFVAGLVGVGGGIIFTPVLLVYFQQLGLSPVLVPKLTIGTSLVCTGLAALASARDQYRRGAVDRRAAVWVGISSAGAVFLITLFVTTQPWYDATVFQVVFAGLLLIVALRMARPEATDTAHDNAARSSPALQRRSLQRRSTLLGIGSAAGAVATAAGVGGGIVLVPAYARLLRMPIHRAVGTSSATIVLISLAGVVSYAALGWHADGPATALGYVDLRGLLLAMPAVVTARLGVRAAHRLPTRPLRLLFAALAAFVALRMLHGTVPG
jgi:hypothetical protein